MMLSPILLWGMGNGFLIYLDDWEWNDLLDESEIYLADRL